MKKKITAMILSISILLSMLSGCGIIVKNNARDYAQIVAEVGYNEGDDNYVLRQRDDEGEYVAGKKQIEKLDLVIVFMNNASTYLQYGMTASEIVDYLLENLINRELLIQEAIRLLDLNGTTDGYRIEDVFTEDEMEEIHIMTYDIEFAYIYDIYLEVRSEKGLDKDEPESEEVERDEDEYDMYIEQNVQNPVFTLDEDYIQLYDIDKEPTEDLNWIAAVSRYEKILNNNEEGQTRAKYYNEMLVDKMETILLEKHQEKIENDALEDWLGTDNNYYEDSTKASNYVNNILMPYYEADRALQEEKYKNDVNGFLTALSNGSESNLFFIPDELTDANGYTSYFYVKNLLVKYDEKLQAEVDEINAMSIADSEKRKLIDDVLSKVEADDNRGLFEYQDQTLYLDNGQIEVRSVPTAIEFPTYLPYEGAKSIVKDFNHFDYYDDVEKLYFLENAVEDNTSSKTYNVEGGAFETQLDAELATLVASADFKASNTYDNTKTAYENAFAALIFKYGDDPGMFNNAKDYLVTPYIPGTSETYVTEFAIGARTGFYDFMQVINAKTGTQTYDDVLEDAQEASFTRLSAQSYGWHFVIVTDVVKEVTIETNASDILTTIADANGKAVTGYETSIAYSYSQQLETDVKTNAYTKEQTRILKSYEGNDSVIIKHESTYKDLLNIKL